jgi:hypothetical protein
MKTIIEDWDESIMEVEDYQVERAMQNAALDAIRRARQFGTSYVIYEDGRVKALGPNETEPYEKRGLANLERLNKKIAELQKLSSESLALNDMPKQNT